MNHNKFKKMLPVTFLFITLSVFMVPAGSGLESSMSVRIFSSVLIDYPSVDEIQITINTKKSTGTNRLEVGIYIGSYDTGKFKNDPTFRNLAKDANVKLVAFMENRLWAVPHPCTHFPDQFSWSGMDTLVRRIFEIGAEPLVVLGFWYTSGVWTVDGYKTPTAEEWGAYCAEWVKHFKAVGLPVKYYDIGHETHQYTNNPTENLTKLQYVIDLYIAASSRMRAENPDILISTDNSMDIGTWTLEVQQEYLKKGATFDFLCWHRYVSGNKNDSTATLIQRSENDEGGVMGPNNWIEPARQNYYNSKGVWLPVVQAGGNLNWAYSGGTDPRLQNMVGAVCMALSLKLLMLKGVEYNNVYTFGGSGSQNFGIVNVNTLEPYYPYYVYRMVGPNIGKGDSIIESSSGSSDISTIAWLHGGTLNILLINKVDETRKVALSQVTGELSFWKIDNSSTSLQAGMADASRSITMNGYTVMLLQTASP